MVSSNLRTRLEALKSILNRPEFAPPQAGEQARAEFMTRLDGILAKLRVIAESKKTTKDDSKDKTAVISELRGRAIAGLRLLAKVGRAAFRDRDDAEHANLYMLKGLRTHGSKRNNGTPASPASPPPAGSGPENPAPAPKPVTPTPQ